MRKLLIADSSEEFRIALSEELAGSYVIRCCRHGKEALEALCSWKPDLVILDLMMPELDGISILSQATQQGVCPMVLATTRFTSPYIEETISRFGVGYLMVKPCDIHAVSERLTDLTCHLNPAPVARPDMHVLVTNVLLKLGFCSKHDGYKYLREAIPMAVRRSDQQVTKQIYPEVGRMYNANKDQVERAIRSAIEYAFKRGDAQLWRMYFQPEADGKMKRPSNGVFIFNIATRLKCEELQ